MHDQIDTSLDLRILRDSAELQALEPAWRELWLSDPDATPFQHPAWLLPWWQQFHQPDLRVITLTQHGRLIGLLPIYIYRDPRSLTRRLLLLGAGTSDYLDGVFAPACTPHHILQALDVVRAESTWDQLNFTQLRPSSKLHRALAARSSAVPAESCSCIPATPVNQLPRTLRRNIAYYRNRALRSGTPQFEIAGESAGPQFFDALIAVHNQRWSERGKPGVLSDPRVLAWHREAIPLLAQHGLLHFSALRLNGEIMAALYGLIDPPGRSSRTLYAYLPSFSPRFAALSPGTLLLAEVVDHAAAIGVPTIDMLRGDEPYKRLWHAEQSPTCAFNLPVSAWSSSSLVAA